MYLYILQGALIRIKFLLSLDKMLNVCYLLCMDMSRRIQQGEVLTCQAFILGLGKKNIFLRVSKIFPWNFSS